MLEVSVVPNAYMPEGVMTGGLRTCEEFRKGLEEVIDKDKSLRQQLAESQQEAGRLREDAERFRALVGCTRVRVLGSAGLDPTSPYYREGYAHIGVELWTQHNTPREEGSREDLTKFADIARAALRPDSGKEEA